MNLKNKADSVKIVLQRKSKVFHHNKIQILRIKE